MDFKDLVQKLYKQCAVNAIFFIIKYCKIQHPKRGRIAFNLYPFQKEVLKDFDAHRFNIILKSRQLGISTLVAAYALWKMVFNKDYNVLVIATTQETAKNLVTKVRVMYEGLPSWIKNYASATEDNKLSLRLSNGSQIKAVSSNENSARSMACSLLVLDEFAFLNNDNKIWTASQQTLSTGGNCIILSTPNGVGNMFFKLWNEAEIEGKMNTIRLPWTVHPERDQTWRDEQTALLGEREAAQECDCEFSTSGNTVIDSQILTWYQSEYISEPIEKRGIAGDFWIWEYPNPSSEYVVAADVSRGDGSDFSTAVILEVETLTQVAEFKSKIGTRDFGRFLVSIATEWNQALLVVENGNIGWDTVQEILNCGYRNLYYSIKQPNYIDEHLHILKSYDLMDKSKLVPGFTMSSKTRPLVISRLQTYMLDQAPIIKSKRLIKELFTFIWNGSKAEARSGYNDDLVMAYCIALWVRDTAIRLRQSGIEITKKALSNIQKPIYKINSPAQSQNSMQYGGIHIDLSWL